MLLTTHYMFLFHRSELIKTGQGTTGVPPAGGDAMQH